MRRSAARRSTPRPHHRAAALTGAALVTAAATAVVRRRSRGGVRNPAAEPARSRPAPVRGHERTVTTEDGVDLHVEEHGPAGDDAAAVLVLAHGYTQASRLWNGTVRDLLAARPDLRVVVYDHRGHGRSGRATQDSATLEQLGRDLAVVVEAVSGDLPVLLGGHSMGGMTIMALAEARPDLLADRVAGVAFVGTSAGELAAVGWGLPRPLVPVFKKLLPRANELAWKAEQKGRARTQIAWFEAFVNFSAGADPADVQDVLEVQKQCSAETMHFFLATFAGHDRLEALATIGDVPVLVVVGEDDRLCPVAHSRRLAEALPGAELVVFPGAGHMVHLERRPEVSRHLARLVDRALAARRTTGAAYPAAG